MVQLMIWHVLYVYISIISSLDGVWHFGNFFKTKLQLLFPESRIGRQPNAIKHATFLKLCRIKSVKGLASPTDPFSTKFDASNGPDEICLASPGYNVDGASSRRSSTASSLAPRKKRPYVRRKSSASSLHRGDASASDFQLDMLTSCVEIDAGPWQIKRETESPPSQQPPILYDDDDLILAEDAAAAFDYSTSGDGNDLCPDRRSLVEKQERWMVRNPPPSFGSQQDAYGHRGGGGNAAAAEPHTGGQQTPTDVLFITDRALPPPGNPRRMMKGNASAGETGSSSGSSAMGKDENGLSSPDLILAGTAVPSYGETIAVMRRAYFDLVPILSKVCELTNKI